MNRIEHLHYSLGGSPETLAAIMAEHKPKIIKRCRKHKPELIDALRGLYRCTSCGKHGRRSYGQRKFGRPPRMLWWAA